MNQQYMYFLNGEGSEQALKRLIHKLATKAGPGAIIVLDGAEFKLAKQMIAMPIGPPTPPPRCEHGILTTETCITCGRFPHKDKERPDA